MGGVLRDGWRRRRSEAVVGFAHKDINQAKHR